jgi:hypothetical protein
VDARVPEISKLAYGHSQIPQMSLTGSDFAFGRRYARLSVAADVRSSVPSHVLAPLTEVFDEPEGERTRLIAQAVFQAVYKIESKGSFARIAKNGKLLRRGRS